jgi:hypothetical protein
MKRHHRGTEKEETTEKIPTYDCRETPKKEFSVLSVSSVSLW